jgi:hypothetical protein
MTPPITCKVLDPSWMNHCSNTFPTSIFQTLLQLIIFWRLNWRLIESQEKVERRRNQRTDLKLESEIQEQIRRLKIKERTKVIITNEVENEWRWIGTNEDESKRTWFMIKKESYWGRKRDVDDCLESNRIKEGGNWCTINLLDYQCNKLNARSG